MDDEPDVAEPFRQRFRREIRQGNVYLALRHLRGGLDRLAVEIEPTLATVLSDIKMPGMDGLQLLVEIKAAVSRPASHDGNRLR